MGLDVRHFAAVWHVHKIGQFMTTDLDELCGSHGISLAGFHVLGALLMEAPAPLRATDLAHALHVTNAALSKQVARLAAQGLLICAPCPTDRRIKLLTITDEGGAMVETVGRELEAHGRFAAHFRQLPPEDQDHFDRIAEALHARMARDFLPVKR
jgi:DNA-binding MarR family transcriptional regulator